jgi:hypothetical protein
MSVVDATSLPNLPNGLTNRVFTFVDVSNEANVFVTVELDVKEVQRSLQRILINEVAALP